MSEETKSERRRRLQREVFRKSIPSAVKQALDSDKDRDERLAAAGSLLSRPMMIGMGTALGLGYGPVAKAHLTGESTLFHGTSADSAHAVTSSGGLKQKYAGKVGRFNAYMQPNAILNAVEDITRAPLSVEERARFMDGFHHLIERAKGGEKVAFSDEMIGAAKRLAKKKGLKPEQLGDLNQKLNAAGRRIYFGSSPSSVRHWGSPLTELEMSGQKLVERLGKSSLKNLPSFMIGGLDKIVRRDVVEPIRYRVREAKAPREKVTLKELPDAIRRHSERGSGAILRTSVPTKTLGVFKDFPVIGHLVAMNRPVQDILADASVHTYAPGRDFSIAEDVPSKNIVAAFDAAREFGRYPFKAE